MTTPTSRYFEAQFPGKCVTCGEDFRAGRRIAYVDGQGVTTEDCEHKDEPLSVLPSLDRSFYNDDDSSAMITADRLPVPPPHATLCDLCFLYHGPGQVECW